MDQFIMSIQVYDGMLIETGGNFGRGKLGGDKYPEKCLEYAKEYLLLGGNKQELISFIQEQINLYETDKQWKYVDLELKFLNEVLIGIEKL